MINECEIGEFIFFAERLRLVYEFKEEEATLSDYYYANEINFKLLKTGQIKVYGTVYGPQALQHLEFEFMADQTCLKNFIKELNRVVETYLG